MKELLTGLIGPISGLLDKVITDKDAAAKLAHEILTMADRYAQEMMLAQIAVNKAEKRRTTGFRPGEGHYAAMSAS